MWALVALHLGLVGAWRLVLVCKAVRVGAKDFLKMLPGLPRCERGMHNRLGFGAGGAA
jgi:hypothetical protein